MTLRSARRNNKDICVLLQLVVFLQPRITMHGNTHIKQYGRFYECDGERSFRRTVNGIEARPYWRQCNKPGPCQWHTDMTVTTCDELQAFHPMVLTLGSLVSLCKKSVHKYRTGYWTERYVYSSGRSNCHTRSSQDPRFSESGAKRATFSCPPGTPLLLPSVQNHPNHKLSTTQTMDTLAAERVTVLCGPGGERTFVTYAWLTVSGTADRIWKNLLYIYKYRAFFVNGSLLSFGAVTFIFLFDIQKFKDWDMQNCNCAVLYGCETWSLTLRKGRTLWGFQNGVLRWILGAERDEVTWKLRKIHNEELTDLYCTPNIVRVIKINKNEMGGACSTMRERRGIYRILVGKPEVRRPFGRPRRRWEDNIKMDLQVVGCGVLRIGTGGGHLWMR